MRFKKFLLLSSIVLLVSSCGEAANGSPATNNNSNTNTNTNNNGNNNNNNNNNNNTNTQTKITVNAHTLSDSNPPIDVDGVSDRVDEDQWNSFRYGGASK